VLKVSESDPILFGLTLVLYIAQQRLYVDRFQEEVEANKQFIEHQKQMTTEELLSADPSTTHVVFFDIDNCSSEFEKITQLKSASIIVYLFGGPCKFRSELFAKIYCSIYRIDISLLRHFFICSTPKGSYDPFAGILRNVQNETTESDLRG
jgi:hypothetical protein